MVNMQESENGFCGQTGPRTDEGKAVVRWNARSHGLRSLEPVVPGLETPEEWEAHREGLFRSLQPAGELEEHLAERIALGFWRLRRVARHERETIALGQETAEEDSRERGETREQLARALQEAEAYAAFLRSVPEGLANVVVTPVEAASVLIDAAGVLGECDFLKLLARAEVVPPGLHCLEEYAHWNRGRIREGLAAIANAKRMTPEVLLGLVTVEADRCLALARERAEVFDRRLDRTRRRRVLPVPQQQTTICRYEAHISRELYKAMHELEAMQARRAGQAAPLARIEVHGDPAALAA